MPRLRFVSTVEGVNTIELEDPLITIGRGINNVVCIEDANISKHHALLIQEEGSYKIFDLHSVNGTAVNGERITVAKLKEGDAVRIGYLELSYEIAAPVVVAPAKPVLAVAPPAPVVIEAKPGAAPGLGSRPRLGFGVSGKPAGASASATSVGPPAVIVPPPAPAPVEPPPVQAVPVAKEEKRVMIQVPAEKKPLIVTGPPPSSSFNTPPAAPAHALGGPPKLRPTVHQEPAPAAPAPAAPVHAPVPAPVVAEQPAPPAAPVQRFGGPRLRPSGVTPPPAPELPSALNEPPPEPPPVEEAAPEPVAEAQPEAAPEPPPADPAAPAAEHAPAVGPKKFGAPSGQAPKFRLKRS